MENSITIHTGALLSKQVWQQVELTVLVAKFTGSLAQSMSVSLVWSLVWYGIPIHWADADGRGGAALRFTRMATTCLSGRADPIPRPAPGLASHPVSRRGQVVERGRLLLLILSIRSSVWQAAWS